MKQPEDVHLSREEGEALLARLEANTLTAEDRRVLGKVLTFYFWLLFALREAKLSLKRVKALVFGEKPKKREPRPRAGPLAVGVLVERARRRKHHRESKRPLCQKRPRRSYARRGMGDTEPKSIVPPRQWRAVTRS
jgi:hypothetical protein